MITNPRNWWARILIEMWQMFLPKLKLRLQRRSEIFMNRQGLASVHLWGKFLIGILEFENERANSYEPKSIIQMNDTFFVLVSFQPLGEEIS